MESPENGTFEIIQAAPFEQLHPEKEIHPSSSGNHHHHPTTITTTSSSTMDQNPVIFRTKPQPPSSSSLWCNNHHKRDGKKVGSSSIRLSPRKGVDPPDPKPPMRGRGIDVPPHHQRQAVFYVTASEFKFPPRHDTIVMSAMEEEESGGGGGGGSGEEEDEEEKKVTEKDEYPEEMMIQTATTRPMMGCSSSMSSSGDSWTTMARDFPSQEEENSKHEFVTLLDCTYLQEQNCIIEDRAQCAAATASHVLPHGGGEEDHCRHRAAAALVAKPHGENEVVDIAASSRPARVGRTKSAELPPPPSSPAGPKRTPDPIILGRIPRNRRRCRAKSMGCAADMKSMPSSSFAAGDAATRNLRPKNTPVVLRETDARCFSPKQHKFHQLHDETSSFGEETAITMSTVMDATFGMSSMNHCNFHVSLSEDHRVASGGSSAWKKRVKSLAAYYGRNHIRVAEALVDLGIAQIQADAYSEATRSLETAVAIYRPMEEQQQHWSLLALARALHQLGIAYHKTETPRKARPTLCANSFRCFGEALKIRFEDLGPLHPDTATTVNCLGDIYMTAHIFHEARRSYLEVLSVRQAIFGINSPCVALAAHSLANASIRLGNLEEATMYYVKALDIYEAFEYHHEHPCLARLLRDMNRMQRLQET